MTEHRGDIRDRVALDEAYLRAALEKALARRTGMGEFKRLVWSESDDLPGVVADQFGDTLVVQIQTLAMEKRSTVISDLLAGLTGAKEIIFRNDANIRRLEGLPLETHTRSRQPWAPRWVTIEGIDYWLDLEGGQKTGFYLDQRFQHHGAKVPGLHRRKRALEFAHRRAERADDGGAAELGHGDSSSDRGAT